MYRTAIFAVLTFILVFAVTNAQDSETPNYDYLFSDQVRIVSAEVILPTVQTRPQIEVDNEARVVRFRNLETDEIREYPYPDEVETFIDYNLNYNANTLQLILATALEPRSDSQYGTMPVGEWRLDLNTGTFTQLEVVCGVTRQSHDDAYWLLYESPETGEFFYLQHFFRA
ncbi:MAG: hypothetical protein U0694_09470 [Anaerolineae bacterium]